MTLENCKRLLAHYEKLSKGEGIPENNKNAADVMHNAKVRAELMKIHIAKKEKNPKYANSKPSPPPKETETKSTGEKNGKK